MTLTTKYGPGEFVWVMNGSKPQEVRVSDVLVHKYRQLQIISYAVPTSLTRLDETQLFATKQALLDSL